MDTFERRIFLLNLGWLLGDRPRGLRLAQVRGGERLVHVLDGHGTVARMPVDNDGLTWHREVAPGLWRPIDRR